MAPPRTRRPGYSRKAQYGLFAGYVIAVSGALFGLLLIVTAWVDPAGHNAIRALITDITTPVSSGLRAIVRGTGAGGSAVLEYVDAGSKNAALRKELETARRQLIEARGANYENRRLKRLLGIAEKDGAAITAARITSSSASSTRRFAILDRGNTSGVQNGQPVRGPDGLIGRVIEAGHGSARIQLITDTGNVVPVIRVTDGLPAIATGNGDGSIDIRALSASSNVFKPGDVFVTSGTGGVYPPRIPVAIALTAAGDGATARPLANPARLDYALVLPVFVPALVDTPVATPGENTP